MIRIDMQMPEKCGSCPCFHSENPMYCQAVKADKNKKIVRPYGSPRPEWCPLKEQDGLAKAVDQEHRTNEYLAKDNERLKAMLIDAKRLIEEQQKLIDDIMQRRANNGAFD